tara:strand:+ start:3597 stop:3767 length:171 start_codon:yes stop_codon:yes gene_type:complete
MPIKKAQRYIGEVCVIDATGLNPKNVLVVLRVYNGQDIKKAKRVNCVDSKHNTKYN